MNRVHGLEDVVGPRRGLLCADRFAVGVICFAVVGGALWMLHRMGMLP